ncbi:MAG: ABC transporter substrate-binding protein [Lachnospiraceae bacterium]|nr:ABC transporter substrate-binding protein [Lachnospiraceae bacterium]
MKKYTIKIVSVAAAAMLLGLTGCAANVNVAQPAGSEAPAETASAETETAPAETEAAPAEAEAEPAGGADETLNLSYQYGLSYAPAVIAQEKGLIEKAYNEATGGNLTVTWTQMSSGADINTAIAAGELDGGFMGVGPAVTGVTKGLGYKIFTNLSGQEHGMTSNDPDVNSLGDLVGSDKQIALVNTGSIQHIILAKALVENGYGAHDLDANIVAMKHPDGKAALESGSVACHLTSSPYIFSERENSDLHEIKEVADAYTVDYSFIVGIATEELHDSKPEVYAALCDGIKAGMDLINSDPEGAAAITCELDGNTPEVELDYMKKGTYNPDTNKLFEVATFMYDNEFIENAPGSYEDLVFDNVKGN